MGRYSIQAEAVCHRRDSIEAVLSALRIGLSALLVVVMVAGMLELLVQIEVAGFVVAEHTVEVVVEQVPKVVFVPVFLFFLP